MYVYLKQRHNPSLPGKNLENPDHDHGRQHQQAERIHEPACSPGTEGEGEQRQNQREGPVHGRILAPMGGKCAACRQPIRAKLRPTDLILTRRNPPTLWIFCAVAPITWGALWHNTAPVIGVQPVKHKFFNN